MGSLCASRPFDPVFAVDSGFVFDRCAPLFSAAKAGVAHQTSAVEVCGSSVGNTHNPHGGRLSADSGAWTQGRTADPKCGGLRYTCSVAGCTNRRGSFGWRLRSTLVLLWRLNGSGGTWVCRVITWGHALAHEAQGRQNLGRTTSDGRHTGRI